MYRAILAGLALLLALPGVGQAQVRIEITGGQVDPLPIAIVPLQSKGGGPEVDVAGVIRDDLHRTGLFKPLQRSSLVARPASADEVNYANWRAVGGDYLVVGSMNQVDGGDYAVDVQLIDVYGSTTLLNKRYRVSPNALRTLGHRVANAVFEELVGRQAGFDSRLLYVKRTGPKTDSRYSLIYADADGHNPQTILSTQASLLSPAWSPDGSKLAYVSFESDRSEIYIQQLDSGERRKVASFQGLNSAPAFSPDGEKLALTLSRSGNPNIFILDLSSGSIRQLTSHYGIDTKPAWSGEGDAVLFTSDRSGGPQIHRVAVDGGDVERVTYQGEYNASADLSPNGRLLAMVHRESGQFRIAVKDLENGDFRVLTKGSLNESPSFAPSGAMIVYARKRGGVSELATVAANGRVNETLKRSSGELREPAWPSR